MREGKRRPVDKVLREAENEKRERVDLGTWDGFYHLSVFAGPLESGETLDEAIARLFGTERRVKFARVARLSALEDAGFGIRASRPDPYHYDVRLGTNLTPDVVDRFEACFGEARRNPAWRS